MLGERLSELRKDKGLTQKEFAAVLNVSEPTISAWERNIYRPDDEMKIQLARFFDVTIDYLLGLTDERAGNQGNLSEMIYFSDLSPSAKEELETFLEGFRKKYHL